MPEAIPFRSNGAPRTKPAPSAATLILLLSSAAALSDPSRSSVSIRFVGPPSKKSPSVSTSGVVAAISARPKAPSSPALPNLYARAAFAAKPPGTAN